MSSLDGVLAKDKKKNKSGMEQRNLISVLHVQSQAWNISNIAYTLFCLLLDATVYLNMRYLIEVVSIRRSVGLSVRRSRVIFERRKSRFSRVERQYRIEPFYIGKNLDFSG